jgi:hypothetical protein
MNERFFLSKQSRDESINKNVKHKKENIIKFYGEEEKKDTAHVVL